jgi:non-specific serine/threonine protein kinase
MREGDIVASRYRVRRQAGAGGMGTVYEAFDTVEGAPVALKTWRAAPDTEPRARSRMWREAHALAELRHPAIVRYVDHGTSPEHGPFLAMAWIAGETLADRLKTEGLRPAEALRLTVRLAEGLAAMHAAGVVHRDLKPSNVMLAGGEVGHAIIVDFGVARVARLADASASGERGGHLGTARYMAPEQVRNARTVDGRADVFALGCILFEALTGRPAFEGIDPVIVLARILFEALPVPSAVRPDLPASFDRLVLSMLARELDQRPSAAALADLIRTAQASVGAHAVERLGASPVDGTREGAELELTSAAESSHARLAPLSRRFAPRAAFDAARTLPAGPGTFLGREEECRHLSALLRAGTRVVSVWGSPGIGKTRLIAEAVRSIAEQGDAPWDEIVFGELADARDSDDVVRILARDAGVALESSAAPEVALGNALAKLGRVLLVVDPVDHVATSLAAALVAWNRAPPGLQVMAASRSRWRLPGAVSIEVGPLGLQPKDGGPSSAASLFLDRARQHWPAADRAALGAGGSMADRAERLVTALDGIPLAIELYAARLPVLGMDALLLRLPGRSDSETTLDASEGAMTRAVAWSWNLLSKGEQRAFAQCAVFRGGFTIEAAERVVSPGDGAAPMDLIQSLREKSLLSSWAVDALNEVRLTMFASVREFAWGMLKGAPDFVDTLRRHAAHYAEALAPGPNGVPVEETPRVEREAENLFGAAEFSLSEEGGDVAAGLLSLMALEPAMLARGAIGGYRGLLDRAVQVAGAPGLPRNVELLGAQVRQIRARLDAPRGKSDRAKEDLELCLGEAEREGDAHWRGGIELDLGVVFHLRRELARARRCYQTALELLRAADDPRAEGRCIGNLGALCHDEGDFSSAARWYRQAIALFEEAGDARQRANHIGNLAVLEQELGHGDAARELFERAVQLLETIGDARLLAITLGNFGVLELEMGRPEPALALHERSLALLSGSGDRRSEALCLGRLGAALALLGRIDEAEAKLLRGDRLAPRDDLLVAEVVRLQGAFLTLARGARIPRADGAGSGETRWTPVRQQIERVRHANAEGRSLCDQSDDIRSTLRILEAELARVTQA